MTVSPSVRHDVSTEEDLRLLGPEDLAVILQDDEAAQRRILHWATSALESSPAGPPPPLPLPLPVAAVEAEVRLGRIVSLHYRSSASYQIR